MFEVINNPQKYLKAVSISFVAKAKLLKQRNKTTVIHQHHKNILRRKYLLCAKVR